MNSGDTPPGRWFRSGEVIVRRIDYHRRPVDPQQTRRRLLKNPLPIAGLAGGYAELQPECLPNGSNWRRASGS
jgi:hypothetical protein